MSCIYSKYEYGLGLLSSDKNLLKNYISVGKRADISLNSLMREIHA